MGNRYSRARSPKNVRSRTTYDANEGQRKPRASRGFEFRNKGETV